MSQIAGKSSGPQLECESISLTAIAETASAVGPQHVINRPAARKIAPAEKGYRSATHTAINFFHASRHDGIGQRRKRLFRGAIASIFFFRKEICGSIQFASPRPFNIRSRSELRLHQVRRSLRSSSGCDTGSKRRQRQSGGEQFCVRGRQEKVAGIRAYKTVPWRHR